MTEDDFIYYEQLDRMKKNYIQHKQVYKNDLVYYGLLKRNKLIITTDKEFTLLIYFITLNK